MKRPAAKTSPPTTPDQVRALPRVSTTRAGPKALSALAQPITRPLLGKRGFASGDIVAHWPAIVGPALATHCRPRRIAFPKSAPGGRRGDGTLHLIVDSGAVAMEIQHLSPLILERINGYFGWSAVTRLAIRQTVLPRAPRPTPDPPPPTPARAASIEERAARITDPELAEALRRLGRSIAGRELQRDRKARK